MGGGGCRRGQSSAASSPRTAVRSRHCGAPALLLAHPPGAPRHSRCAMAKAADVWSDLRLVFWLACLLPFGPARVAAGKQARACLELSSAIWNLSYRDDSGVVPLLDTPVPRSRPALRVSPCSPSMPAPALCPGKHIHPDTWDWYSLGGRDREHGCMLGTPGGLGERSWCLSLPQGEPPPPIACMGQRFCFKMSPFSRDFHRDCVGLGAAQVLVYSRGGRSAISSLGMI